MSRRAALLVAAAVGCLVAPLVPADAANATAAPTLVVTYAQSHLTANTALSITVTSSHLPGATAELQRATNATTNKKKKRFEAVETLPSRNGTFTAPGLPMGHYVYRVVATRHQQIEFRSATHTVYFYGSITVQALCHSKAATFASKCGYDAIPVGDNVFEYYVAGGQDNTKPDGDPDVQSVQSSCRRVSIMYAVSNDEQENLGVTKFGSSLTQVVASPQTASATPGSVATASFKISSAAWDLAFWSNNGNDVFWNGKLSCWSPHGLA